MSQRHGHAETTLLLTGHPPGGVGVGELYMASIASLLEAPLATVVLRDRHRSQASDGPTRPNTLELLRRYESAWRPVAGLAGEWMARAGVDLRLAPYVRRHLGGIVAFARAAGVTRVIGVLDSPTAILLAEPVARALGCPLHSLVWDMPDYLLNKTGHSSVSSRPVLRAFDRAMRCSTRVAVMSHAMQEEIESRHSVETVILHQPVDPAWLPAANSEPPQADEFVIGFAGSVTARDEMEVLMEALDRCGWVLGGRRVRVRVFGLRMVCQASTARCIEYRGYLPEVADVVAELAQCELLFLPQPFGHTHERFSRYSFPTKLTTYLAAGRPILLLAPPFATLSRFFTDEALPFVCNENSSEALLGHLQTVATDRTACAEAERRLADVAYREFSLDTCKQRLNQWLACA